MQSHINAEPSDFVKQIKGCYKRHPLRAFDVKWVTGGATARLGLVCQTEIVTVPVQRFPQMMAPSQSLADKSLYCDN